jgi:hypothetical protein
MSKPVRFKVLEIEEWKEGWVIVGHSMAAGTVQASPTARLAGCKVEQIPAPADLKALIPPDRMRLVFRLKNPEDHERFTRGQKVLLDL